MQPQTAETPAPARRINLPPTYMALASYVTNSYFTLVPLGHTPDDLLVPSYWMHVARKLKPNYFIRVRAEDGSFDGELLVLQSSDTWAKCVWFVLNHREGAELASTDHTPQRDRFKLEATAKGWRVIEKDSGKTLAKDLPQRSDAEAFVADYIANLKN